MKIVARYDSSKVLFEADVPTIKELVELAVRNGVSLIYADLRGANLRGAILRDAILTDAGLRGADLRGANLRGAILRDAILTDADLMGADLTDAIFTGARLTGAILTGAILTDADVPSIANIDAAILKAIEAGGQLNMSDWHTCETTHCRAGWAIYLAGEAGRKLEEQFGSSVAGALIYAASRPNEPVPNFYTTDEEALADIRAHAAKQTGATS